MLSGFKCSLNQDLVFEKPTHIHARQSQGGDHPNSIYLDIQPQKLENGLQMEIEISRGRRSQIPPPIPFLRGWGCGYPQIRLVNLQRSGSDASVRSPSPRRTRSSGGKKKQGPNVAIGEGERRGERGGEGGRGGEEASVHMPRATLRVPHR